MLKLKRPVSLFLAQAMIAVTLPVSALAAPVGAPYQGQFELPINEKLDDASLTAYNNSAPIPGVAAATAEPTASAAVPAATEASATPVAAPATTTTSAPSTAAKSSPAVELGSLPDDGKTVLEIEDILKTEATPLTAGIEQNIMEQEVLVVDNDKEEEEVAFDAGRWKEMTDEPGKTKITSGAVFPVVIISALSSKTSKVGDPMEARLKVDIKIGGKLVAKKGDKVMGHVSSASKARRILHAELSRNRWMRANGCVGLQFDEIVTESGEHLPLTASPARRARIVKNANEGRVLGVNDNGEIATPLSGQLKAQAAHLAIRGAASVGGVFSFGIVPAAYGIVGAINPSFAFLHPVGKNVPHRRLKGFAMGVVSGLPGGFLIADTIIKGQEAEIKPGDEFLAEFKQDFTGEASSSAAILPGSQQKVKGQVVTPLKTKKKHK